MLQYLIVSFLVFASLFQEPEKYVVINVQGTVTNRETKLPLKKGDKILSNNKLSFKTIKDKVDVLSPSKGRFTIAPQAKYAKDNEFVALVKEMIAPAKAYSMTAVRGSSDVLCKNCTFSFNNPAKNNIEDLRFFFSRGGSLTKKTANDFYVLGRASFGINKTIFPMNNENYFCVRYINGKDTIIQKLSSEDNQLIFKSSDVPASDGLLELYYVQPTASSTEVPKHIEGFKRKELICYMKPVFVSEKAIQEDINLIIQNASPNTTAKDLFDKTILPYLLEVYANNKKGIVSEQDIKGLLPVDFLQKMNK